MILFIKCFLCMLKKILFYLTSFVFLASLSFAQEADKETPVQVNLLSGVDQIKAGESFYLALELKMAEGWDTYWKNPGDLGLPTKVEWILPEGFEASEMMWPTPERFLSDGVIGYGYKDSVMLFTKITPPMKITANKVHLKAMVHWLACGHQCLPGEASLSLDLPIGEHSTVDPFILEGLEKLPKHLNEEVVKVTQQKNSIDISISNLDIFIANAIFIPEHNDLIDAQSQKWDLNKHNLTMTLTMLDQSEGVKLSGILVLTDTEGKTVSYQIDQPEETATKTYFYWVILCAFLGGLILNAMPCVLPILGLKIMGFVKSAGEKRSLLLKHGLSFTLGVVLSFWVLSAFLLILRASGENIGWGFQLQEPIFVAILASILFILSLSLFGMFELGTSLSSLNVKGKQSGVFASFCSGMLATIVATPCTGPFLGPAIGVALALAPLQALIVFTAIALGMSFPYLLLTAFPQFLRFLPKPGPWMLKLKWIMGGLMLLSTLWLLWVFLAQTSIFALLVILVAFVLLGIAAWVYGKWGSPVQPKKLRNKARLIALCMALMVATGSYLSLNQVKKYEVVAQTSASHFWEPYSYEKLQAYQNQGKPVFIDFTAKWCLICQANKVTLYASEVQKIFEAHQVVTMTADWTKKDAQITQELEKMGRSGVPLYVLYPADSSKKPVILPQNLTTKAIKEAIAKLDAH